MKVKNFIGADINDAMLQVKLELGSDAIILSQEKVEEGIKITAALDDEVDFDFNEKEEIKEVKTKEFFDESELRQALSYHGVVEEVVWRILSYCREEVKKNRDGAQKDILAEALKKAFYFSPLLKRKRYFSRGLKKSVLFFSIIKE